MQGIRELEAHLNRVMDLISRIATLENMQLSPEEIMHVIRAVMVYEGLSEVEQDRAIIQLMEDCAFLEEHRSRAFGSQVGIKSAVKLH